MQNYQIIWTLAGLVTAVGIIAPVYICVFSVEWSCRDKKSAYDTIVKCLVYCAGCVMTAVFIFLFSLFFYNAG